MDIFVAKGYSPTELRLLNDVRMYKQVTRLSDIVSADGQVILDSFLTASPPTHPTPYTWPRCYRPSQDQISFWKATLISCFIPPHATHRRLSQPLGPWLHDCDQFWEWWHSPTLHTLYRRTDTSWTAWLPTPVVYRRPHFNPSATIVPSLPDDAIRVTVSGSHQRRKILNSGHSEPTPIPPAAPTSLSDLIDQLPPSEKWALEYIDEPNGSAGIAASITSRECFAVSDASLKDGCGTAAFILVGPDDTVHPIRAVHQVPGPIPDGNSFRCELSGLFGVVLLVRLVCVLHNITEGSIHVRCDNNSALKIFDQDFIPNPAYDSFDLVHAIWTMLRSSPLIWTAEWVQGHQDALGTRMDRFAALNCQMDALAGTHRVNTYFPGYLPPQIDIANEGWSLWCGPEKLHSPTRTVLYDRIYAPKILQYWSTSHDLQPTPRIPPASIQYIDWDIVERLMKILPLGKRIWCTKHGSEQCGVGITMQRWKKQRDNCCPLCGAPENTTHVLRCTAQEASATWTTSMTTFNNYLMDVDCPPEFQEALTNRLTAWRLNIMFVDSPTWSEHLKQALHQQDAIGWKNFMEGLPSKLWVPYIQSFFSSNGNQRCPLRWFTRILHAAHNIAWSQWEYRNHYLHEEGKPRYKQAVQLLNFQITSEFLRGVQDLPAADHHYFSNSLQYLLSRSTSYKKHWYTNVLSARQCQDRRIAAAGVDRSESIANARLVHWIRTGRLQ
jgi:hypothetical protein